MTDPRPELRESFKELMFKDDVPMEPFGELAQRRFENSDFNAEDVLPPLLDLALENESGENTLRPLIEKTIKVIEADNPANDIAKDPNLIPLVDALPAQIKSLPPITISGSWRKERFGTTRDSVCFQLYAKASSSSSSSSSNDEHSPSSAESDIENAKTVDRVDRRASPTGSKTRARHVLVASRKNRAGFINDSK